jgi:ABC-2 type transport system permease protein
MVAISVVNAKANKTLETLLSLPVERNAIVLAKLSGAAIVAFLFAGVYLIGFHSYMNDMAGDLVQGGADSRVLEALGHLGLTLDYSGYLLMFVSLFFGILCALSIAMILGLLAEDVKGAQIATLPVVILVLIPYFLTMVMDIESASPVIRYLVLAIPFSHPFLATSNIFMGRELSVVWGILYQGAVFVFFVTLATKLFSSEAVFTLKLWRPRKSV